MLEAVVIDPNERYAIIQAFNGSVGIFDFTRGGRRIQFTAACALPNEGRAQFQRSDGSVWQWQPGDDAPARIGTFATHAASGGCSGSHDRILAVFPDHLEVLTLSTGRIETAKLTDIDLYGVRDNGQVWLRVAKGGGMWVWDPGGAPKRIDLPVQPDDMWLDHGDVLLYTHESITLLRGASRHVVSSASALYAWGGGPSVALLSAAGEVDVLDMDTELGYRLPISYGRRIAIYGRRVAVAGVSSISVWTIDVPDDAKQLQAWLATITNAKAIEGTEAYTWP
jgi:hypothetical protein